MSGHRKKSVYFVNRIFKNSFHVTLIRLVLQKLYNIKKRFTPVSTSGYVIDYIHNAFNYNFMGNRK